PAAPPRPALLGGVPAGRWPRMGFAYAGARAHPPAARAPPPAGPPPGATSVGSPAPFSQPVRLRDLVHVGPHHRLPEPPGDLRQHIRVVVEGGRLAQKS